MQFGEPVKLSGLFNHFFASFYPDICQICRAEHSNAAEGYVGSACRNGPDGIQIITPPFCRACGTPFEGDIATEFTCSNCKDEEFHFRSARAAARFTGVVQETVHRYKYESGTWFETFLAELLVREARPALSPADWDCIVPIPLHRSRLRKRSFNQAERLARHLSRATGIPMQTALLRRTIDTDTQTNLTRKQRAANVRKAFAFRPKAALDGERIILVDDVLTTGATADACARILRKNGASLVDVWTVARGVLR